MEKRKIFEIPVYSTSQLKFDEQWNYKKQKYLEMLYELGHKHNDAKIIFKEIYLPYSIWIYNRIIGYISLSIKKNDVIFDLYLSKNKQFPFNSKRRTFIQFIPTVGLHFYAGNMSDQEIKKKIKKFIEMINNDFLKKKRYIDLSIYNNIINYLNFKDIIDDLNKPRSVI